MTDFTVAIICNGKFHHFHQARALQDRNQLAYIVSTYPYCIAKEYGIMPEKFISVWPLEVLKRCTRLILKREPPYTLYSVIFNIYAVVIISLRSYPRVFLLQAGYCLEIIKYLRFSCSSSIILDRGSLHTDVDYALRIKAQQDAGPLLNAHALLPKYNRFKKRERQEYSLADLIMVPSDFVKESFEKSTPQSAPCFVNPFPPFATSTGLVDQTVVPSSLSCLDAASFNILFVGQKSSRKGFHTLISSVSTLVEQGFKINLIAIGALADIILPSQPWIVNLSPCPQCELAFFYSNCDALCLPSYAEGLPLVLCEASHYGMHLIASRNTGIESLLSQTTYSLLSDPSDPYSLANIIHHLYLLKADLSRRCFPRPNPNRSTCLINNSWSEYITNLLSHYADACVH
jgi:glycosyltransferase involved in cell wall biosynthesis